MSMTDLSYRSPRKAKFPSDFKAKTLARTLDYPAFRTFIPGGYMELIRIVGLMAILLFAAAKASAQSNDVYNFYFQKGQAPGSVVQGGQQQSSPQPAAAPPQPAPLPAQPENGDQVINNVVVAPKPETSPVLQYNHHEFTLGIATLNDPVSDRSGEHTPWAIGYQYNFNRYVSMFGQGTFIVKDENGAQNGIDRDDPDYLYGGMLGVAITPIHLDLFGHKFLRVSALFGGRTERVYTWDPNDTVRSKIRPLVGASAEVFLNQNVGLRGSVAMGTEDQNRNEIAQATGSLVMSF